MQSWFWSVGLERKKERIAVLPDIWKDMCFLPDIWKDMCFFARYLERYVFFARYLERYVFCLVLCALWLESCGVHLLPKRGSALCFFLHSSGREELDSLPIVLELENTLWFSNSCLQLGTNSFAGIVLELCMDRELVAKMGEPIPIFYTLVNVCHSYS